MFVSRCDHYSHSSLQVSERASDLARNELQTSSGRELHRVPCWYVFESLCDSELGLIDEGESVQEAGIRELFEETGYRGSVNSVCSLLALHS